MPNKSRSRRRMLGGVVGAVSGWAVGHAGTLRGATSGAGVPAETDSKRFRSAVVAGDLEAVGKYLEGDPSLLYARDERGNSVYLLACLASQRKVADLVEQRGLVLDIFEAAAGGKLDRVKELCRNSQAIVHSRLPDGRTPLHLAAAAGQTEVLFFISTQGADLSGGPESPLLAAVNNPDMQAASEMGRFLLGNASDPNARRSDASSALHLAAARGYAGLVEMLVHRGAAWDVKDGQGRTPLDAATGKAVEVLRGAASIERVYFAGRFARDLRGNKVTREDSYGLPQQLINQFVSVAHTNAEEVKRLLKMCPSLLMTRATWDELAIEAAAHMGLVALAQHLADAGSPVSTCTAAVLGLSDVVQTMLRDDPHRLRERGAHDLPLLAYAAFGLERTEMAALLLKAGANVHVRAFGQTTLHLAAAKGYVELARLLLESGADVNAAADSRRGPVTPLAVAIRSKQSKMEAFLKDRGGRV